jgi:hypothetical protein
MSVYPASTGRRPAMRILRLPMKGEDHEPPQDPRQGRGSFAHIVETQSEREEAEALRRAHLHTSLLRTVTSLNSALGSER